jgi:hypothetical protein
VRKAKQRVVVRLRKPAAALGHGGVAIAGTLPSQQGRSDCRSKPRLPRSVSDPRSARCWERRSVRRRELSHVTERRSSILVVCRTVENTPPTPSRAPPSCCPDELHSPRSYASSSAHTAYTSYTFSTANYRYSSHEDLRKCRERPDGSTAPPDPPGQDTDKWTAPAVGMWQLVK